MTKTIGRRRRKDHSKIRWKTKVEKVVKLKITRLKETAKDKKVWRKITFHAWAN